MEKKSGFSWGLLTGIVVSICVAVCTFGVQKFVETVKNVPTAYETGNKEDKTEYTLITGETGSEIQEREATDYRSIVDSELTDKMQNILATIDEYYYLNPISEEEMEEGIYAGIMNALGDPYSVYYTKEELEELMNDTTGIYYGIGAYVSIDESSHLPKISGVIEGTPAETSGLHPDDLIFSVDGVEVFEYSLNDAVALIRGEEGTTVELKIVREGEKDYLTFQVQRAKVESPTVKYKDLGDGIAYIQITQFDTVTLRQWDDAVDEAKANGMEKLIIDLRDNPGGSLSTVVEIADEILPSGMIVYTEDKKGDRDEYKSDENCIGVPMVVLVNGNSASASEILSGAIKDYKAGTIMGTTTYGKGIVQQIVPFSDGTGIKITISSYFTPNGHNIHGTGIEPDVEVEFDKEAYYSDEKIDTQLDAAIEYLNK